MAEANDTKFSNPHDALVKRTFGSVEHAEGELRAVLPRVLVEAIDWKTLTLEPQPSVNEMLRVRQIDLLYRVKVHGRPTYLYTVFEAQRTVDKTMPLRLLVYMARIWDDWLRTRKEADDPSWPPPPVVPIVLYHGDVGWSCSTQFSEMFELDERTMAALSPHLPQFEFVLDDLTKVSDKELLDRLLSSLAHLVLGILKHGTDPDLDEEFFLAWQEPIRQLLAQRGGSDELHTVMWYLFNVNPVIDPDSLGEMMMENFGPTAQQVVVTTGQRLREEGREEGREFQVKLVSRILTHRFGELPKETIDRIQAASIDALNRWADVAIDADRIADVFAEESTNT